MSERKIKFGENVVSKKDFYASKKAVSLDLVDSSKIVISDKFKINNDSCKFFIDYSNKDKITSLFIILPQMSGFIKHFEDGGKNMSFRIEDKSIYLKYSEIWNKIRKLLNNTKFHSQTTHKEEYIKTKLKIFSSVNNTFFQTMRFLNKKIITFVLLQFLLIL